MLHKTETSLSYSTKFTSFLKLIRLPNLLIVSFTQLLVLLFLIGPKEQWHGLLLDLGFQSIILATLLVTAAGYIINDYYDLKIDFVNKPERVVIGRSLSRRWAIIFHFAFNFLGTSIAFFAGWKISLIVFTSAFILWLYSNTLKRLPLAGNITVAFMSSLSLIIVGLYFHRNFNIVLLYSSFAFFISLIREIIKDMEDIKGDEVFGCKTLPIVLGIRKSKQIIYLLQVILISSLIIPGFYTKINLTLYFYCLVIPSLIYLTINIIKADHTKDFTQLSQLCKWIMLIGIISMLFS